VYINLDAHAITDGIWVLLGCALLLQSNDKFAFITLFACSGLVLADPFSKEGSYRLEILGAFP